MKPTLLASFIKLILLAGLFLPLAVFFGYRNQELMALLVMLGSPTTVSSYIMAKNTGNDGINIQHHCPDDTFVLTDSDALDFCFKEFRSPVNYCRFASPFSSKYSTRTCPSDIITRHMYRESFKE